MVEALAVEAASDRPSHPGKRPGGPRTMSLHLDGRLELTLGQASEAGAKERNEDCIGLRVPEDPLLTTHGMAAVIADGVSSAEAGREASESCVQSFLSDYFSTPDSWSVKTSVQTVLTALNRWLYGQGHQLLAAHRGYVTTLSILVAKSRTAHLFHVGDSRIYRLRDGTLEQLTVDHQTAINDEDTYLTRAMGMDARLDVDYRSVDLEPGDCFLLTTDGVHDSVPHAELTAIVSRAAQEIGDDLGLEKICHELNALAIERGSQDNVSCQFVRVDALPPSTVDDLHRRLRELPFPPAFEPGQRVDGLRVEAELHASSRSQLYKVIDEETGAAYAMKTPSVNFVDDPSYLDRFIMEPWIGGRVESPNVVRVVSRSTRPSFLYYLQEFLPGRTLEAWIADNPHPPVTVVIEIVEQIVAGLRAFHRREMLHQDLKPANVIVDDALRARLIDFGSTWVAGIHEIAAPLERDFVLGTASYSAPELRRGTNAGVRSEIFALGTLVYEMLTGQLPYGEAIDEAMSPRDFDRLEYTPSYHHNPMVPVWLDGALRMAVRVDPARRYAEMSEFVYDLKHPNPVITKQSPLPLIERDPVFFWRGVAGVLAAGWAATLWWLLA